MVEIPPFLLSQVQEGAAILFLGAGASRDAVTPSGVTAPTTMGLRDSLSDKFLGGGYKTLSLTQVAEYAINESDLGTLQSYIATVLRDLQPTDAHKTMCRLTWYGLATTNYDLLIEQAYSESRDALQTVRPLIESNDHVEDNLREPKDVLLLKLHGCITRVTNPNCPLILTTDQYIRHREGRARLFEVLKGWSYEHPIIFIGQSLQDPDLRAILLELSELGEFQPRYYFVAPDVDPIATRFWDKKKITAIKATFREFMLALDGAVPVGFRSLWIKKREIKHPIERKIKVPGATLSRATEQFMQSDVDYVYGVAATEQIDPRDFYKGFNKGFAAIEQNLDVRRKLGDSLLADYFLRDVQDLEPLPEIVLVSGHAGAGKTVLLRRVAWDASRDYDRICLFLKRDGLLSAASLQEIIGLCKERVYLFIDNAVDRIRDIRAVLKSIGPEGKLLTMVLAARTNEWNIQSQDLGFETTDEYEVKYLRTNEIESLLKLLEKHNVLGTLTKLPHEKRMEALEDTAGRQLLVALHEATLGVPFEEILEDEFNHIQPFEAQRIYLTVCVLNRLHVPVRAGIVARIHGVPFEEFKAKFFSPLEHVVFAELDSKTRDYVYRARHPHIAEIVFSRILSKSEERFDAYVRCIEALNLAYSVDSTAFWLMVRARNLMELFADYDKCEAIFEVARRLVGEDAHLLHQRAIYEMRRPNGSLSEAGRMLERAENLAPWNPTIKHTMAELRLRAAAQSKTELEKNKWLREAAEISQKLISSEKTDSYAYHTLVKINIRKLEDAMEREASESEITQAIKDAEQSLSEGQQQFLGDSYLSEAESQLASLLKDNGRVRTALNNAFNANPRAGFIAKRLASIYESEGENDAARSVLDKALAANDSDRGLHYALAKLIMRMQNPSRDELIYHLRRAFTDGDHNYDARVLYGRELFLNGDLAESRKVFSSTSDMELAPGIRRKLLYPTDGSSEGTITKIEPTYCFIARDGSGDSIYANSWNVDEEEWKMLTNRARVRFKIAFTVKGPSAFDVELISSAERAKIPQLKLFKGRR